MSSERGTQTNKQKKLRVTPASTSNAIENEEQDEDPDEADRNSRMTVNLGLASDEPVFSCLFEVFGIVQGVSFRMYTLRRAQKLGVRGWCSNTKTSTVKGEIEGHNSSFEEMRLWLKYTGSPTSRIDKVVFGETTERPQFTYENFTIVVE
ncbi:acylphosphatase-2 [Drosophila kikkawai]|uniref:acylphosphatase n=1 Tax=Drosophila kikkawai TaxID=30033 RepID=A0A6P4IEL2_DROKI|nr:acylphosphatase-2 [Drosophila kikkawai]